MGFKDKILERSDVPAESVPASYQLIGDIVLMKFPEEAKAEDKKKIAAATLELFPYVRVVCEARGVEGEFRAPKVKVLAAREANPKMETTHKEHGILYKLDVGKIMFSKGNLAERARLVQRISPGEILVDMFAGIGYFSLGLAKSAPSARIIAVEKNKVAYKYLKENVALNKLANVKPILGDCRKIRLKNKADRVLMGYFPGTHKFLPAAFRFLSKSGIIHYHNLYRDSELWNKPLDELEKAAKKSGFKILSVTNRVVKSYKPHVRHVVIDVGVERA